MFSSFRFCLKILSFVKKDEKKKGMNEIVERASELVERASEELHFVRGGFALKCAKNTPPSEIFVFSLETHYCSD